MCSSYNDAPQTASRPFDAARAGVCEREPESLFSLFTAMASTLGSESVRQPHRRDKTIFHKAIFTLRRVPHRDLLPRKL